MSDSKIMMYILWIALLGIVGACLTGCTVKLQRVVPPSEDLDTTRYQIIESYKQGMYDILNAQEEYNYEHDDREGL